MEPTKADSTRTPILWIAPITDFDEIPHTEKCSRQQHEDQPRDDISHQEARKRLFTRDCTVHDRFCLVVQPNRSLAGNRRRIEHRNLHFQNVLAVDPWSVAGTYPAALNAALFDAIEASISFQSFTNDSAASRWRSVGADHCLKCRENLLVS